MTTETKATLAVTRTFDSITIPNVQAKLDSIKFDLADAADLDVCSADMAQEANEMLQRILSVSDDVDKERLALTKELRDGTAWVNDGFKPATDVMKDAVTLLKGKLVKWDKEVNAKRLEAERLARADQEARAAEIRKQARVAEQQAAALKEQAEKETDPQKAADLFEQAGAKRDQALEVQDQARAVEVAPVKTNVGDSGVKGQRTTWKCRILDKHKALLIVVNQPALLGVVDFNEAALNALAKVNQGKAPLPGFEFYEEDSVTVRRK